jgi:hypothetical protein
MRGADLHSPGDVSIGARRHRLHALALPLTLAAALAACMNSVSGAGATSTAPLETSTPAPTTDAGTSASTTPTSMPASTEPEREDPMTEATPIRITVGDTVLDGRLWNIPPAQDLIAQLPLTMEFRDLNNVEKIARLPEELTMDGVPPGDDPEPQDIGYYAPSGDLVFYYGDVGYWNGIVRLGVFDSDVDAIRDQSGPFIATIELAD